MQRFALILLIVIIVVGVAGAQAPNPATVSLAVSGMKCDNCVSKVEKALRGVDGVKDVKVDLENQTAEVVLASASVKSGTLVKAVTDAGFKATVGKGKPAAQKEDCSGCEDDSDCKKEGADAKKDGASAKKQGECCKDAKKATGKN